MKRIPKLINFILPALLVITGCKKVFDIKPQDQLDQTQAYQNVYEAIC